MGFLSFLNRKSSGDRGSGRLIKTQAYDTTTAAHPPVRGTYPVTGNGPNVLDKLQQAAKKRSTPQLSAILPNGSDTFADFAAPSPMIPRYRDSSISRPTSAPYSPKLSVRSRSVGRNSQAGSPAMILRPDNESIQEELLPPVPPIPPKHRRRRRSSLGSTNRFIDILDAQGEFRPSNFRSRVEAAGAREFGEDVADRNMGVNSSDLSSQAVQAFYRSSFGAFNHWATPAPFIPKAGYTNGERSAGSRQRKRDTTPFTKTADVSAWNSFSECHEVDVLRHVDVVWPEYPRGRRIERRAELCYNTSNEHSMEDRRRSFHSFNTRSAERSRPRPLSLHPSMSNFHEDESYPPPLPRSRPRTSGGLSETQGIGTLEVQSLVDEAFDEPAPFPSIPGRPKHTRRRSRSEGYDWPSQLRRGDHMLGLSRPSSSSSLDVSRPRAGSLGGSSILPQRLDDISEHIPVRTSSLGLNSQPCFTPTSSSSVYSSNAFTQPLSHHTPSTSIDASMGALSEKPGHDMSPGGPDAGNHNQGYSNPEDDFNLDALVISRKKRQDGRRAQGPDQQPMGDGQYMSGFTDDSDVDSFVGNRGRGGGEEELLFNEGTYSTLGGLPGLFDSNQSHQAPAPLSKPTSARHMSMSSPRVGQNKRHNLSRPHSLQARRRPRSHKSFESRHELKGDLDAFLELQHEFLRTAGPLLAASFSADDRAHGRRSMYEFDEDDELDIQTTRVKKDPKRADTVKSLRGRRPMASAHRRRTEDDSGHTADTED